MFAVKSCWHVFPHSFAGDSTTTQPALVSIDRPLASGPSYTSETRVRTLSRNANQRMLYSSRAIPIIVLGHNPRNSASIMRNRRIVLIISQFVSNSPRGEVPQREKKMLFGNTFWKTFVALVAASKCFVIRCPAKDPDFNSITLQQIDPKVFPQRPKLRLLCNRFTSIPDSTGTSISVLHAYFQFSLCDDSISK